MTAVAVVIPARDEAELIGRCLRSVLMARRLGAPDAAVIVVADGCLDNTVQIARSFNNIVVLEIESSNVGAARAAGAAFALDRGADWLANTDADSVVPPNWLHVQRQLAAAGRDLIIGTVRPDFRDLDLAQRAAWEHTHERGRPNGHVHGANLGVRSNLYRTVGGYRALPEHEDNDLVDRLMRAGAVLEATDANEVVTSGRKVGRTPGGYARFLRDDLLARIGSNPI